MEKNDFTQGNILSSLIRFALPVLAALFLQAMYGAVDLLVVGRFAETADVSGVATGSLLIHTFTMLVTGLAMGITVLVAQAVGRRDREEASRGIGGGIFLFALVAAVMTALLVCLSRELSALMQAPPEAMEQTNAYVKICGMGSAFIVAYNLLGSVFRGLGDSKTPLLTVAIACAVNIAGDLLFVAVFHMGAAGAALATVIAQGVSVLISVIIIKSRTLPFDFSTKYLKPDFKVIKHILKIGVPVALQDFLVGISFLVVQTIVNSISVTASAGTGVAEKVCAFLMLVATSYMQSMSAFVAQNIGAGQPARAKRALMYGILTSLLAGTLTGAAAFFFGDVLASLFSSDGNVIMLAHEYLKSYAIDCVLTSFLFCFIGYYNGIKKTFFCMIQGIFGAFFIRIPAALLISRVKNVTLFMIGLATPISTVVQIIICLAMFALLMRREKKYE